MRHQIVRQPKICQSLISHTKTFSTKMSQPFSQKAVKMEGQIEPLFYGYSMEIHQKQQEGLLCNPAAILQQSCSLLCNYAAHRYLLRRRYLCAHMDLLRRRSMCCMHVSEGDMHAVKKQGPFRDLVSLLKTILGKKKSLRSKDFFFP